MLVPVPCILRIPWLIDFLMRKAGRQEPECICGGVANGSAGWCVAWV